MRFHIPLLALTLMPQPAFCEEVPDQELYALKYRCQLQIYTEAEDGTGWKPHFALPFEGLSDPKDGSNGLEKDFELLQHRLRLRFTLNPRGFVYFQDESNPSEGVHFEILENEELLGTSDFSTTEKTGLPPTFTLRSALRKLPANPFARLSCKLERKK